MPCDFWGEVIQAMDLPPPSYGSSSCILPFGLSHHAMRNLRHRWKLCLGALVDSLSWAKPVQRPGVTKASWKWILSSQLLELLAVWGIPVCSGPSSWGLKHFGDSRLPHCVYFSYWNTEPVGRIILFHYILGWFLLQKCNSWDKSWSQKYDLKHVALTLVVVGSWKALRRLLVEAWQASRKLLLVAWRLKKKCDRNLEEKRSLVNNN